ncbi:MAG: GatB/YqeY domain-containing protein [Anaerolineae bacterium]|jgi:hypothetical protein|nr:GatB/YqeY domain-containing protein [Anaerolineae bacterium]
MLKSTIEKQLLEAMKNKDDVQKVALRTTLSSIKLAEIENGKPLDDAAVITIIQKEIKIRKESISDAQKSGRDDLSAQAASEILVLEKLLPKQLSEDELRALIVQVIQEQNATSIPDTGKVMKVVIPLVMGRAPNDLISKLVKEYLAGQQ